MNKKLTKEQVLEKTLNVVISKSEYHIKSIKVRSWKKTIMDKDDLLRLKQGDETAQYFYSVRMNFDSSFWGDNISEGDPTFILYQSLTSKVKNVAKMLSFKPNDVSIFVY